MHSYKTWIETGGSTKRGFSSKLNFFVDAEKERIPHQKSSMRMRFSRCWQRSLCLKYMKAGFIFQLKPQATSTQFAPQIKQQTEIGKNEFREIFTGFYALFSLANWFYWKNADAALIATLHTQKNFHHNASFPLLWENPVVMPLSIAFPQFAVLENPIPSQMSVLKIWLQISMIRRRTALKRSPEPRPDPNFRRCHLDGFNNEKALL